jgi:hypothetical protein
MLRKDPPPSPPLARGELRPRGGGGGQAGLGAGHGGGQAGLGLGGGVGGGLTGYSYC